MENNNGIKKTVAYFSHMEKKSRERHSRAGVTASWPSGFLPSLYTTIQPMASIWQVPLLSKGCGDPSLTSAFQASRRDGGNSGQRDVLSQLPEKSLPRTPREHFPLYIFGQIWLYGYACLQWSQGTQSCNQPDPINQEEEEEEKGSIWYREGQEQTAMPWQ